MSLNNLEWNEFLFLIRRYVDRIIFIGPKTIKKVLQRDVADQRKSNKHIEKKLSLPVNSRVRSLPLIY